MLNSGQYKFTVTGQNGKRFFWPVSVTATEKTLILKFSYNKSLLDEIKSMEGARWNPNDKTWSIENSIRNWFTLRYLMGENVYERWDRPLQSVKSKRSLYAHQGMMLDFCVTRRQAIIAGEMGTGKTLVMIELMEQFPEYVWWYVGTKSSIRAVALEFLKWDAKVRPQQIVTYDSLKRIVENWQGGMAPQGLIFDESSRLKNATTKRSQMAKFLAKSVIEDHGSDNCFIIEMSGSPAPKEPTDWWNQAETACPGYLKESSAIKLKKRLAIIEERESNLTGGKYPHLVSWLDDETKCAICGQKEESPIHGADAMLFGDGKGHSFKKSTNEVENLHHRMKGLVLVKFKKDCLDLPEKQYVKLNLEPAASTLRAAALISKTARGAADALVKLRELSDGFQYKEVKTGNTVDCANCGGSGQAKERLNSLGKPYDPQRESIERENLKEEGKFVSDSELSERFVEEREVPCEQCQATGKVDEYVREAQQVPTPKEDALIDILEDHEDIGRLVVYAGFTGSIERVCSIVKKVGWEYVRMDGKGIQTSFDLKSYPVEGVSDTEHALACFQKVGTQGPEKLVFIGHPQSAGMGLTLTAAPTTVYWSNDFNAESRIQSEDRIHRAGMDKNRGATIVDLIHLDTDQLVLDNLQKKRDLQAITLGEVQKNMEKSLEEAERR